MTEQHNEPTRYLTYKLSPYVGYLKGPPKFVLLAISHKPSGTTFDELRSATRLGPRHLRAVLANLFEREYIMSTAVANRIKQSSGIDMYKLRTGVNP